MGKKLTNFDIKSICLRYLYDEISMEQLAQDYACSSSHISKCIHKAIILRYSRFGSCTAT